MGDYLLGIDVGTYETKGVLTTVSGEIAGMHAIAHRLDVPQPGWAEHDAERVWWHEVCELIRCLLEKTRIRPAHIAAVGCSAIAPAVLPVDRGGSPLRKGGILYGIDTRAEREIRELNREIGAESIFSRCGNALSSQSAGPKIRWLKHHEPEVYREAAYFVPATSFIVGRLTERWTMDHYTASAGATPMYSIRSGGWDRELCAGIVEPERLPVPGWTTDIAGYVTARAARQTGLSEGTAVIVGTSDSAAEAVSAGVVDPGQMMVQYGSSIFLIQPTTERICDPRLWSASYLFPDTYCLTGGMSTAGTLTRWFRDQFAADLHGADRKEGDGAFAELERMASNVPPGSEGLILLPYFSGERTPVHDAAARGVAFGLTLAHTRAHVYRAILEGIGYGIRHNLEVYEQLGARCGRITAVGGGTASRLWLQIVSDICGCGQLVPKVTLGASYGDAFLAGLGVGAVSSPREIDKWISAERHVVPETGGKSKYDRSYSVYRRLYERTGSLMRELQEIY